MKRALVFDSGVGGLSVVDAIAAADLAVEIVYAADNAWLPYGEKAPEALRARIPALIAALATQIAPDVIVLACNTASTLALDGVRALVRQPVVGVVPPIKPAALMTRTGVIGLLATPATAAGAYVDDLIARHAPGVVVIRCGATALVEEAERKLRNETVRGARVAGALAPLFTAPRGDEIDVVALACTHFPLLRADLAAAAPRALIWLDSADAIARRVAAVSACKAGLARATRAAFTDAAGAHALAGALSARGFEAIDALDDAFQLMPDRQI